MNTHPTSTFEIRTSLNRTIVWVIYSRFPKSERSVWKTEQNLVRISDIQISDIRHLGPSVHSIIWLHYKRPKSEQIWTFGWSSRSKIRMFEFQTFTDNAFNFWQVGTISVQKSKWKWSKYRTCTTKLARISVFHYMCITICLIFPGKSLT